MVEGGRIVKLGVEERKNREVSGKKKERKVSGWGR